jgi:hypothetical protein
MGKGRVPLLSKFLAWRAERNFVAELGTARKKSILLPH